MNCIKTIVATLLILAWGPATAGELGRVEFDGRQIILFDDNRWEFAETGRSGEDGTVSRPANCTEKASKIVPVSICLDMDEWVPTRLNTAQELGFANPVVGLYLILLAERTVVGIPALKKAAKYHAENAPGAREFKEVSYDYEKIDDKVFGHFVYELANEDVRLTYSNYQSSFRGKGSVQVIVFATTDLFAANEQKIAEVVAGISVTQ